MSKDIGTVEFFIRKVREKPCLWNRNHVTFRDVDGKDITWERVAKECGMANGREAKTQWKRLRDSHREALRRRKHLRPSAPFIRQWKYEEDMKFIVPQMDSKEQPTIHEETDDTEKESVFGESSSSQELVDPLKFDTTKRDDTHMIERDRDVQKDDLLRQIIEMNKGDALSKFFDSMCEKTRELPRYLQLRVQREVFNSVSRAEEEALSLESLPRSRDPNIMNVISMAREHEDYAMEDDKNLIKKNIGDGSM